MIQLAICAESLAWFGIMLIVTTLTTTISWIKINDHYTILKAQTKQPDYYKVVFKMWFLFFGLLLLMLFLCALPFIIIDAPEYF
jgi:amino acid permease